LETDRHKTIQESQLGHLLKSQRVHKKVFLHFTLKVTLFSLVHLPTQTLVLRLCSVL